MTVTKTCLHCKKEVIGRADKKFCDDHCRNAHYNAMNSDATNYIRKVNNILRKNRRILKSLNVGEKPKVNKSKLLQLGFQFQYYTNVYVTKAGKQYVFCYEQGYLPIDNDWFALVFKKDYVY